MKKALKPHGKAVVVDLKEHQFTEFRKEMGDIHLGFNLEHIEKNAKKFFKRLQLKNCLESAVPVQVAAQLFVAYVTA